MIIDFNRYNGGGGSGSGSTDLTNYWNSAQTESAITVAVEPKADKKILVDFDRTPQEDRATLYATLKALYDGGSGATINKDYDFFKTVGPKQGLKIDYYTFSGGTAVFGKVVSPDNISDQVVYGQVLTIDSAGSVNVVTNTVGGGASGDSTVLKAVEEFPDVMNIGDLVSKIIPIDGFYWDNSDNTTDKMHIDLDVLDTEEEYQIATFTAADGPAEVYLGYDSDEVGAWMLRVNVDGDDVEVLYLTEVINCNILVEVDEGVEFYAGIGYLPDDYSGQGGMMIQIGRTNGSFGGWNGSVTAITDYTDYDIPFEETIYAADGPYYYDGEDWVSIKEETEKTAEDKVVGAFPRMPHFNLDNGGTDIEQIKSAIFDVNGDGDPISEIWLYDTTFEYLDNNVDWNDADVPIQFTIDPEEKVAYIENIPAGNYIFGLSKGEPGENYDPGFDILYWSKNEGDFGDWDWQTIENTCAPWVNPNMEMNQYWRDKFDCSVAITNQVGWFNWSFPKDVKRFEIRIVDDGQGNESLEINTTYDDSLEVLDQIVSAALVDLNEKKVESEDIKHMVKLTQADYDQLVLDDEVDPETFYIIVNNML